MSRAGTATSGAAGSLCLLLAMTGIGSCDQATRPTTAEASRAPGTTAQPEAAPAAGGGGGSKVALLVGISRYDPATGWTTLHTEPDLALMRGALEAQGFAPGDIHELVDADADREGIEAAFRQHLIQRAAEGAVAVAVFHYSGHGHRLTDDDHDEIDGYDEVLVPFDAPQDPPAGYTGGRHVRDDELHDWVQLLRRAVGPTGDVLISLDSCFSGSGTRSAIPPTATARGIEEPIGPPQTPISGDLSDLGPDRAGGFDDSTTRGTGPAGTVAPGLAPYVFFSAARHDELAFETRNEQHLKIGSLSFALGSALTRAGAGDTYRGVFDEVRRIMAARVRNRPQAEGLLDREIFAGEGVDQEAFLKLAAYDAATRTGMVRGGALAVLLPGSRVVVHAPGTREADPAAALANGAVVRATPFLSEVRFDAVAEGADVENGWVFVTERSYGSSALRASVSGSGAWRAAVDSALAAKPFVTVVATDPDVAIEASGGELLAAAADGTPLFRQRLSVEPDALAAQLVRRLDDYSRNRWLRQIEESSRDIKVRLEMRPCRLETRTTALGQELTACAEAIDRTTAGGGLEMRIGDGYELALVNEGRKKAHVAILDLWSDGRITQLWPFEEEQGEDKSIDPGQSLEIEEPFEIGEPTGSEMLKLMATDRFVNYWPVTSRGAGAGTPRGFIDTLFAGASPAPRSVSRVSVSSVGTYSLAFNVVEGGDE